MVNMAGWVPDRGDVVWIDFNPQAGSEQAGRRPAVVLSPAAYNGKVGLAIFCPITRQVKDYPFEVQLPEGVGIAGVILSDRIKSLDWRSRNARPAVSLPRQTTEQVLKNLGLLLT